VKQIAGLTVFLVLLSCSRLFHQRQQSQEIDGIIFIDERQEREQAKATKPKAAEANRVKSQADQAKEENEIRDFKAMEGIILLDLEDQLADQPGKPIELHHKKFETGYASYYAMSMKGRSTASGERYDPYEMTAAHPSLPFGTLVRVTNLFNNESVVVRINDRGPKLKSRIIDLSYAAAQKLDMISAGVVQVAIEVLSIPATNK